MCACADVELVELKFPNSFLVRLLDIGGMGENDYRDKRLRFVESGYIFRVF
jgi:hypothetical protein